MFLMKLSVEDFFRKGPLIPQATWAKVTCAWLAIHVYCISYVLWGRMRLRRLWSNRAHAVARGALVRLLIGTVLLMTAYVFLAIAISRSQ